MLGVCARDLRTFIVICYIARKAMLHSLLLLQGQLHPVLHGFRV